MKLRHVFLYIVVVCIAVMSSNIAWAQTAITGCTTITQPGSYVLKNNITVFSPEGFPKGLARIWDGKRGCIVIAANFVTIDLSGYLIQFIPPVGSNTVGIAIDARIGRTGDVVHSGSITGFDTGVLFTGSAHTIKEVNASYNGSAGIVLAGYGNRLIGNTATNNGIGISSESCCNVVLQNVAFNNGTDIWDNGGGDTRLENFPQP